jgi:hypothetical protein
MDFASMKMGLISLSCQGPRKQHAQRCNYLRIFNLKLS